jgi:hypothetical protein
VTKNNPVTAAANAAIPSQLGKVVLSEGGEFDEDGDAGVAVLLMM